MIQALRHLAALALLGALVALAPGCRTRHPAAQTAPVASLSDSELNERAAAYAHYATAISRELNDREPEAREHFRSAAAADPANENLAWQVAVRLLQANQTNQAIEVLRATTQSPSSSAQSWAWLAAAYARSGRASDAIEANQASLRKDPHLLMALQGLTLLYLDDGQTNAAWNLVDTALKDSTTDPDFFLGVADALQTYQRARPASQPQIKPRIVASLDRAAACRPQEPHQLQKLAEGYRQMGELAKAEPVYLALLERVPDLPRLREQLADLYFKLGKTDKAAAQLKAISDANPTNEQASYYLGLLKLQDHKLPEAEPLLERTLILRPDFEPVYYDLAATKIGLNKPEEALEILDRARHNDKFRRDFALEYYTGLAHARARNYDDAVRALTAAELIAATTDPERLNENLLFQLGVVHERRKDFEAAARYFLKALAKDPNSAETLNYLGYMWADRGENLEQAHSMIRKAVELEPDNGAYLDSLGWVLFRMGQPAEALPWLEKAIAKNDEPDPSLYDHLGDVLAALGRWPAAADAWRKAIALEPNPAIQKKLDAAPAPAAP